MFAAKQDVDRKSSAPAVGFRRQDENTLVVVLSGDWKLENDLPAADEVRKQIGPGTGVQRLIFDTEGMNAWDSGLLTFLIAVIDQSSKNNVIVEKAGLSQGVQRLLHLATAVPEREGARRRVGRISFLARAGDSAAAFWSSTL